MSASADEASAVVLDRLLALRAKGELTTAEVRAAAGAVDRSERQVWRWLSEGRVPTGGRSRWDPGEADVAAFFAARGIYTAARERRSETGAAVPSYHTFRRGLRRELRPDERAYAKFGEAGRRAHTVHLRWEAAHRNEIWEGDHTQLDVWVLPMRGERKVQPWLAVFVDCFSRAVMGWSISVDSREDTVLAALEAAISQRVEDGPFAGVPVAISHDNAREWLSDHVNEALQQLGVSGRQTDPYAPHQKGKVERVIGTFDAQFVSHLPYSSKAPQRADGSYYGPDVLLTIDELASRFRDYVHRYNHEHPHRSLGGETPLERWRSDPTSIGYVDERKLLWLLAARDSRIVQKDGIRLAKHTFFAPELTGLVGEKLEVRWRPHDYRQIWLFRDDEPLCSAKPQEQLTGEERTLALKSRKHARKRASRERQKASQRERLRITPLTGRERAEDIRVVTQTNSRSTAADDRYRDLRQVARTDLLGLDEPADER